MSEVCQRYVMFPSSCPGRMRSRASSWWVVCVWTRIPKVQEQLLRAVDK